MIAVFPPGSEIDATSPPGFHVLTISIPMDRFGVSPKQYIQARRLNGVHRDLCKANLHGKRISDIANDWGFWHMGQFAADYRKFFGELPSEILGENYFV
jgi:AraC-like DNA-binding protein